MKQVLGAINRQAEVNYAQVLNRTLLSQIMKYCLMKVTMTQLLYKYLSGIKHVFSND
jgi:hypothetical protein